MFKFNFQVEPEDETNKANGTSFKVSNEISASPTEAIKEEPFREHKIEDGQPGVDQPANQLNFLTSCEDDDPIVIKYVNSRPTNGENKNGTEVPLEELTKVSDLVKGVYEGGLKIWECSIDLAEYIASDLNLEGQAIVEVGCGAGIPGLVSAFKGANQVDFQDYNDRVIETLTIPNVRLNLDPKKCTSRFFSGDWRQWEASFRVDTSFNKYDVILTSETIYSVDNYEKLISLFDSLLKPDGRILLSAKIHYFGVGGGLRLFEKSLDSTKKWKYQTIKTFEEGVAREILEISRL